MKAYFIFAIALTVAYIIYYARKFDTLKSQKS